MAKARNLRTFAGALYSEVWLFLARTKAEAGSVFFDIIPPNLQKECSRRSLARYVAPLYWCPKRQHLWFEMTVAAYPRGVHPDLVPVELLAGVEARDAGESYRTWENYGGKGAWKVSAKQLRKTDGISCALVDPAKHAPIERAAVLRNDSAALRIAREIADTEDFTSLPILADALEEAGGVSQLVLDHCRQPGPHRAGCWVIESLLAKG